MRVVVPFTEMAPATAAALDATSAPWEAVDVSSDDESYWRLLRDLWADSETFLIVEHDIVVRPSTVVEMAMCPSQWCAARYPYFNGNHAGMGCAKFGTSLLRALPDAIGEIGDRFDGSHPRRHWCRLDAWLTRLLHQRGIPLCTNHAPVGHVRSFPGTVKPSHGCC